MYAAGRWLVFTERVRFEKIGVLSCIEDAVILIVWIAVVRFIECLREYKFVAFDYEVRRNLLLLFYQVEFRFDVVDYFLFAVSVKS